MRKYKDKQDPKFCPFNLVLEACFADHPSKSLKCSCLLAYSCCTNYHHSKIASHLPTHAHQIQKSLARRVWSRIEPDLIDNLKGDFSNEPAMQRVTALENAKRTEATNSAPNLCEILVSLCGS